MSRSDDDCPDCGSGKHTRHSVSNDGPRIGPAIHDLKKMVKDGADIYHTIDTLYGLCEGILRHSNRASLCEELVKYLMPIVGKNMSFDIAVLTATLPIKSRIPSRPEYVQRLQRALDVDGQDSKSILRGLT